MKEIVTKQCPRCLNEFILNRKDKIFCSRLCKQKISEKRTGRHKRNHIRYTKPYLAHKKGYCEKCGFIPQHSCQLDVDHKDGDHSNNHIDNLQTLCANCHRLKTHQNRDWIKKSK